MMGMGILIKRPRKYFDIEAAQRTIEVTFRGYFTPPEMESESDLLSRIVVIRDDLLRQRNSTFSLHSSPSSVFCNLFLPIIVKPVRTNLSMRITRKSPSKVKKPAIMKNTKKLIGSVEMDYGEKNALFYLEI